MFFRAQLAAILATAADFFVMVLCYQLLGLPLAVAVGCGPLVGGLVNFTLNRYWSFRAADEGLLWQVCSYMPVCLIAALANAYGVVFMVVHTALDYVSARVVVALAVAVLINYPLHRYLVFAARGGLLKGQ
ncbi:MAG: GtrA family protein [Gammaproteobacteria bacterium]|nr:MAG: GtrA family protein [Gammaproteobacteria bacterium]